MDKKVIISFIVSFTVTILLLFAVWFGIDYFQSNGTVRSRDKVEINYEKNIEVVLDSDFYGDEISIEDLNTAKQILEERLDSKDISNYKVKVDSENYQITVSFPQPNATFNSLEFFDDLCEQAVLTFVRDDTDEIVITGENVKKATAQYTQDGEWVVSLELNPEGVSKFSTATRELALSQGSISIKMDENIISCPTVNEHISDGYCMISGDFDADSAQELADKINSGSLPFRLTIDNAQFYENNQ